MNTHRVSTNAIPKRPRRSKVSFAAPIVSKTHLTDIDNEDNESTSAEGKGYERSALLFSSLLDEYDDEEGGELICPPEEMVVTFAFPVVTQVVEIPGCPKDEDKDKLYYSSIDVAAFYLHEITSGRRVFGTNRGSLPSDVVPQKYEGQSRKVAISTADVLVVGPCAPKDRFRTEHADMV